MGEEGWHEGLHRVQRGSGARPPAGEEAEGEGEEEGDDDAADGRGVGAAEEAASGPADVLPQVSGRRVDSDVPVQTEGCFYVLVLVVNLLLQSLKIYAAAKIVHAEVLT